VIQASEPGSFESCATNSLIIEWAAIKPMPSSETDARSPWPDSFFISTHVAICRVGEHCPGCPKILSLRPAMVQSGEQHCTRSSGMGPLPW
jgi:hypothetical protein